MATVLLLPPSEGKAPGGSGPPWGAAATAFPGLAGPRAQVRDAVRASLAGGEGAAGRLLAARGPHLARALSEWDELDEAPTLAAEQRYTGVMWRALDPASLGPAARRRLRAWTLVPSGLWGVSALTDGLPPHRLRMGVSVPPLGPLAAFWRPLVSPVIGARAGRGWVIDLLPDEHAAAVDHDALGPARLVRIDLVAPGRGRAIGHAGKALKGALARAIVIAGARTPTQLQRLDVPGLQVESTVREGRSGPVRMAFAPAAR